MDFSGSITDATLEEMSRNLMRGVVNKDPRFVDLASLIPDHLSFVLGNMKWDDPDLAEQQIKFLKEKNYNTENLDKKQLEAHKLARQILDQGTTGKWTGQGFGSPAKNAKVMADTLASAGITDIKQFGQLPDGGYGNKNTGQAIGAEYTRAGGNIWGGTFTGKNSTGFGVQFGRDGTPYFYTQEGASTSDMNKIAPIIGIGLTLFAPGVGGAIGSALTGTAATTVASQVIGAAVVQGTLAELSGGDFADAAITAAVTAGVAPVVAGSIGTSLSQAMGDSIFREVVVNATTSAAASAVAAAVTGKDVGESAIAGAVAGAASPVGRLAGGTIADAMGSSVLAETVANSVASATTSAISASILNKDISDAAFAGLVSGAASSIGRELGTAAEYGTTPYTQQNQILLNQEKGMGTSGAAGANFGVAAGEIAIGRDPLFSVLNAAIKTDIESSLAKGTPVNSSQTTQDQISKDEKVLGSPDSQNQPDALVPDKSNPNLEPGKTPQQRASEEWQRYLDSIGKEPTKLDLPGSTIDVGEYWEEYNQNLKRIMDEGGYTSQWQKANGDRIFINDDGTGIGINENGGTYALSDTEVEGMVKSGLLNTAESGYVEATGGTGDTPGGSDRCGNGFHWDESRQMCIPNEDEEPKSQDCPEGYVFDLNTQTCVPVSVSTDNVIANPKIKTVKPAINTPQTRAPSSRSALDRSSDANAIFGEDEISGAIQNGSLSKLGLPVYGQMDKFEGPLDSFLKMVSQGSYVNKPSQQPQQANKMNTPNQMDQVNQQPSYFNYGKDTSIDQNLFGGQNSMNYDNQLFNRQSSLDNDQQLFGDQNSMNYDRQLFANPSPFKAGGLAVPMMADGGTTRYGRYAGGGLNVVEHAGKQRLDFRKGAAVTGKGDGQSDDIPAMLADGEFVFPADVVAALGNGSTKAGSDKLYDMMHSIRAYHRSAKPKDLPPPAKKSPLDYLKKPARKARG